MNWTTDVTRFHHDIFIAFIECKIEGKWEKKSAYGDNSGHEVLFAIDGSDFIVHVIEPDGLRRILKFSQGGTISINQNILSYHSGYSKEIIVDEKEKSGKGKTRDILE